MVLPCTCVTGRLRAESRRLAAASPRGRGGVHEAGVRVGLNATGHVGRAAGARRTHVRHWNDDTRGPCSQHNPLQQLLVHTPLPHAHPGDDGAEEVVEERHHQARGDGGEHQAVKVHRVLVVVPGRARGGGTAGRSGIAQAWCD
jgi:hypothetical protein